MGVEMQFPKDPGMLTLEEQAGRFWWVIILVSFLWPRPFHPWGAYIISTALYGAVVVFLIKIGKKRQSIQTPPAQNDDDAIKASK